MIHHHLYVLPTIIDGPGEYVTRGGETVTVESVVGPGIITARAYGSYSCGIRESWYANGRVLPFSASLNDIVAKSLPEGHLS